MVKAGREEFGILLRGRPISYGKAWEFLRRQEWRYFDPNLPLIVVSDNPFFRYFPYSGEHIPVVHPPEVYYKKVGKQLLEHYLAVWEKLKRGENLLCLETEAVEKRIRDGIVAVFYGTPVWEEIAFLSLGGKVSLLKQRGELGEGMLLKGEERNELQRKAGELLVNSIPRGGNVVILFSPMLYTSGCPTSAKRFKEMLGKMAKGRILRLLAEDIHQI